MIMDSELSMKFFWYYPDYLSALSRTLLRYFLDNLCRDSCIIKVTIRWLEIVVTFPVVLGAHILSFIDLTKSSSDLLISPCRPGKETTAFVYIVTSEYVIRVNLSIFWPDFIGIMPTLVFCLKEN